MARHGNDEIVFTDVRLLACSADTIPIPGEDPWCFRSTKVPLVPHPSTARDLLLAQPQKLRAFSRGSAGLPELEVGPREVGSQEVKVSPQLVWQGM